jgi:hypothetical protein
LSGVLTLIVAQHMPMYRIYLLDAEGGFRSRDDHYCPGDGAARDLAMALLPADGRAEVWIGTRRVGLISADHLLNARSMRIIY